MDASTAAIAGSSDTSAPAPPEPTAASPSVALPTPPVTVPPSAPTAVAPETVAAPALREDQVQNAVGFLSHPQVRGSTNTASKRSFLERKGLTAAEIDEAFRRVPEAPAAPPAPAPATAPAAAPAAQQPTSYAPQPGAPPGQQLAVAAQQPYGTAAPTAPSGSQLVAVQPAVPPQPPTMMQAAQSYRWSQVVLGVGVVAAAGWAVQQLVLPRLRSLVDSWQAGRREAEEKRNKELAAGVEVLKGCQQELKASTQALLDAVTLMREQQRLAAATAAIPGGSYARGGVEPGRRPVDGPDSSYYRSSGRYGGRDGGSYGANELSYGAENYAAIRAAAGYVNGYPPDSSAAPPLPYGYSRDGAGSGPVSAGPTGGDGRGGGPSYNSPGTPYGAVRTAATGPYGGGAVQPPESLPYRVTAPPSPTQSVHSLSSSRPSQPFASSSQQQQQQQQLGGMGGMGGPYGSSDRLYEQTLPGGGAAGVVESDQSPAGGARTLPRAPPEQPAYPQSFHEVMEMVQKGITPPNVRTDINDAPPDPTRPLSEPRLPPPSKPWERNTTAATTTNNPASASATAPISSSLYGSATVAAATAPRSYGSYTPWSAPQPEGAVPSALYGAVAAAGGASSGASSLSVLPPANPGWRPPPPPSRTVLSSSPSSPPAAAATPAAPVAEAAGAGEGSGSGGRTASAPAAVVAAISDGPVAGLTQEAVAVEAAVAGGSQSGPSGGVAEEVVVAATAVSEQ
ncbi:hypothetical protein Agub_g10945 [Astrephomene gubernaculifera]|uniref:Peroxisomal membrane protein PEX14 n=1 Tax=Astrephomene gubernaculifera TaxID=47775 RepID=A0AAD3DYH0_9CHLO|nr:hypothetical protein Agub_g10945 [Astrephomene gubernaculifera]